MKRLIPFLILCCIVGFRVIDVEASIESRYKIPFKISDMIFFKNISISNFAGKTNMIIPYSNTIPFIFTNKTQNIDGAIKHFRIISCYETSSSIMNFLLLRDSTNNRETRDSGAVEKPLFCLYCPIRTPY